MLMHRFVNKKIIVYSRFQGVLPTIQKNRTRCHKKVHVYLNRFNLFLNQFVNQPLVVQLAITVAA